MSGSANATVDDFFGMFQQLDDAQQAALLEAMKWHVKRPPGSPELSVEEMDELVQAIIARNEAAKDRKNS